jgi:hypothetical protein
MYTARLRFRVSHKLNLQRRAWRFTVAGVPVRIRARKLGQKICDADWLVMLADLDNEEAARQFGSTIQTAVACAALQNRIGVDVGMKNKTTTHFSEHIRKLLADDGVALQNDAHGISVYPTSKSNAFLVFEAHLTVLTEPKPLIDDISKIIHANRSLSSAALNAVLFANAGMLSVDPVGKLALCVSAIEVLSGSEKWTPSQKKVLTELAGIVRNFDELSEAEAIELHDTILRHPRIGVLESIRRVLRSLQLDEHIPRFLELYNQRSRLFHGSLTATDADLPHLAGEASELAWIIVTRRVKVELGL